MFAFSFHIMKVEAQNAIIYIRADGSIDPPTAPISTHDNMTYVLTGNIYNCLLTVEKSDVVIDGASHAIQGFQGYLTTGLSLSYVNNVTVKNLSVKNFYVGAYFYHSMGCGITACNVTDNSWKGIDMLGSSNNRIVENCIENNSVGVGLYEGSGNNSIVRNMVIGNGECGVWFDHSSNNTLTENGIADNGNGVRFTVSSSGNIINGNNISGNDVGVYVDSSSNNIIYHNNFLSNTKQVYDRAWDSTWIPQSVNSWDRGHPFGGNYWSNYIGVDSDGDGVGDEPHRIDTYNQDHYPLVGTISTFEAEHWDGVTYNIDVVSNSSISKFKLTESLIPELPSKISLNVSGPDNTRGFCRITIPNILVKDLWKNNYTVLLNGKPWPFTNWTESENTYIYINYTHSEHEIVIIPEFPSTLTLAIFMLTTLIATTLWKTKRKCQPP
jgi:parallel beta-helix repeat protein